MTIREMCEEMLEKAGRVPGFDPEFVGEIYDALERGERITQRQEQAIEVIYEKWGFEGL